jgi:hypothetical protein
MSKEQAIKEIETLWLLNDKTTIDDIKKYYHELTRLNNLSIGAKLDYLYKHIIDSMYKDEDITKDVAIELYEYYELEGEM